MSHTRTIMVIIICAGAISGYGQSPQPANDDIIFYASFDSHVVPEIQKGTSGQRFDNPPQYVRGLKGQSLVITHDQSVLYPSEGNIAPSAGTISLWARPLDWSWRDKAFCHFLTVPHIADIPEDVHQFQFILYRFWTDNNLLIYGLSGESIESHILRLPMTTSWLEGVYWHYIVFAWDENGFTLCLDGQGRSQSRASEAPFELVAKEFRIGGPYFVRTDRSTAIDELKIYNRRLTEDEIRHQYHKELVDGLMSRPLLASTAGLLRGKVACTGQGTLPREGPHYSKAVVPPSTAGPCREVRQFACRGSRPRAVPIYSKAVAPHCK